jgi:hypothetical protein
MCILAQNLRYAHNAPQGVTLAGDVVSQEAKHVYSERQQARRQRRRDWGAARVVERVRGEDTSSEPESLGRDDEEQDEDGEEGGDTPSPFSAAQVPSLAW